MSNILKYSNYTKEYRRYNKMSKSKNARKTSSDTQTNADCRPQQNMPVQQAQDNKKHTFKNIFNPVTVILGIILIPAISGAFYLGSILQSYDDSIDDLKQFDMNMQLSINTMNTKIDNYGKLLLALAADSDKIDVQTLMSLTDYTVRTEEKQNEMYLANPNWDETTLIAKDVSSDKLFSAGELSNTPIILCYEQNGRDVYFYGQYNENNQWNGRCILNIYNNNKLETIFEGIYDNGNLFSYKRVSCENGSEWIVTDRVVEDGYNRGETYVYTKTSDYNKSFNESNITEKQIVSVDNFLTSKQENLLSYYSGNTSNGYYNDKTGYAYLVTYFTPSESESLNRSQVIKTLYQGQFVDGKFEDNTYKAWYITRELDTTYMYYRGCFLNGSVYRKNKKEEDFCNQLSHQDINTYLNQYGFLQYSDQFVTEYENQ